jgi:hypothetical protein
MIREDFSSALSGQQPIPLFRRDNTIGEERNYG